MNSEEELLFEFLESIGFEGEDLRSSIASHIQRRSPSFSAHHTIRFGEETMFYELQFRRDPQFKAYRLERYEAIYRAELSISHGLINDVDTAVLEDRMRQENWAEYFRNRGDYKSPIRGSFIEETLASLNRIAESGDKDGMRIQQELMFKYWPSSACQFDVNDLQHLFEERRGFTPGDEGWCNATLAYYLTSERLDILAEALSLIRLNDFPGVDIYHVLAEILSGNPKDFELYFARNEPEGYCELFIPITVIDGWHSLDSYQFHFSAHPAIQHGLYNGVDSELLEADMRAVNWHTDKELFVPDGDSLPPVMTLMEDMQERLFRLSMDERSAVISERLQIKYWTDVIFLDDFITADVTDYFSKLPMVSKTFGVEVNARIAFNLLCGRAVINAPVNVEAPADADQWLRLDQQDKGEYHVTLKVSGPTKDELKWMLHLLPIDKSEHTQLIHSLMQGDLTNITFLNGRKGFVSVNPEEKRLNLYSDRMIEIPYNFHLDPGWKRGATQSLKPDISRTNPVSNRKSNKKNRSQRKRR